MGSPATIHFSSHEREDILTALRVWRRQTDNPTTISGIDQLYEKVDCAGEYDFCDKCVTKIKGVKY